MQKLIALAVTGAIAGGIVYAISRGALHDANGKLLGLIEEDESSFGIDDVVKGMLIVGGAMIGGKMIHSAGLPLPTAA